MIEKYAPALELDQESYQESVNKMFPDGVTPRLTFREAIGQCLDKYADFKGRARRSEYWWFFLFGMLAMTLPLLPLLVIVGLDKHSVINLDSGIWAAIGLLSLILVIVSLLAFLLLFIPMLSVQTRRLHDIGRSGWWVAWSYIVGCFCYALPFYIFGSEALDVGEVEQFSLAFKHSMGAGLALLGVNVADGLFCLLLLALSCIDGHRGRNKYGPSPKYP